jgi:hypothetical protein
MIEYNTQHKQFKEYKDRWLLVDDVARSKVKDSAKVELYLPRPNPDDKSAHNKAAYSNYTKRAVFYNFTQPTITTLIGSMFNKHATIEANGLEYIIDNIDGTGIPFGQQLRKTARCLIKDSRGLIFVDYTAIEQVSSVSEEQSIGARPVAILYKAQNVIDWECTVINNVKVLSRVVLAEFVEKDIMKHDQERHIELIDGLCYINVIRFDESGEILAQETIIPRNSKGQQLSYIPCQFFGGLNNDPDVDDSMIYDLAVLNVAHFQSSADYEDFRYKLGQIQPVITGATQADTERNGKNLVFGSGVAWVLGHDANAMLLQAKPNSINMESMQHKEAQAKAIGAKLLNPDQKVMSAKQAGIISGSESASIATIVSNLESGYRNVFDMMIDRVSGGEIEIALSREFATEQMTPEELRTLTESVFKGAVPDTVLYNRMRATGYISDETTDDELREQLADKL